MRPERPDATIDTCHFCSAVLRHNKSGIVCKTHINVEQNPRVKSFCNRYCMDAWIFGRRKPNHWLKFIKHLKGVVRREERKLKAWGSIPKAKALMEASEMKYL